MQFALYIYIYIDIFKDFPHFVCVWHGLKNYFFTIQFIFATIYRPHYTF